jgi:hypothetical protein
VGKVPQGYKGGRGKNLGLWVKGIRVVHKLCLEHPSHIGQESPGIVLGSSKLSKLRIAGGHGLRMVGNNGSRNCFKESSSCPFRIQSFDSSSIQSRYVLSSSNNSRLFRSGERTSSSFFGSKTCSRSRRCHPIFGRPSHPATRLLRCARSSSCSGSLHGLSGEEPECLGKGHSRKIQTLPGTPLSLGQGKSWECLGST